MTPERLDQLTQPFSSRRIAVLGDFFLDKYLDVAPELAERSVETGKLAHQVVGIRCHAGAAGTIVNNLAALGCATLYALGMTGVDGEAFDLRTCLTSIGCCTDGLVQDTRLHTPTYLKPRNRSDPTLAGEHNRYDTKNRVAAPADVVERIVDMLDRLLPDLDAVILSDQAEEEDCGVITSHLRQIAAERAVAHRNVIFWADSRRRIRSFRNVLIKPNQFEAVGWTDPPPNAVVELDRLTATIPELRRAVGAPVFVTRGAHGMLISDPHVIEVPGVPMEGAVDPTGAGDSASAGCVLALASGATHTEAALIGNLVASITVRQLATTGTATLDQLTKQLEFWNHQQSKNR